MPVLRSPSARTIVIRLCQWYRLDAIMIDLAPQLLVPALLGLGCTVSCNCAADSELSDGVLLLAFVVKRAPLAAVSMLLGFCWDRRRVGN